MVTILRRDREDGSITEISEKDVVKKFGEGALKEMCERRNDDIWFRLSVFADYRMEDVQTQEQTEAADKQAHADHVRETMEDR